MTAALATLSPVARQWAEELASRARAAVTGIVWLGQGLIDAKAEVEHGEWLPMLEAAGTNERTAQRLMAIARNPALTDPTRVSDLPTSWGTLYELSRIEPDELKSAIEDGRVTPETQRKDAIALREETAGITEPHEPLTGTVWVPLPDNAQPPGVRTRDPEPLTDAEWTKKQIQKQIAKMVDDLDFMTSYAHRPDEGLDYRKILQGLKDKIDKIMDELK